MSVACRAIVEDALATRSPQSVQLLLGILECGIHPCISDVCHLVVLSSSTRRHAAITDLRFRTLRQPRGRPSWLPLLRLASHPALPLRVGLRPGRQMGEELRQTDSEVVVREAIPCGVGARRGCDHTDCLQFL